MNQIKQQTKQSKKNTVIVAVIALVTAIGVLAIGTSFMDPIQAHRDPGNIYLTYAGNNKDDDSGSSSSVPYDPNHCIPGNECPPRCPEGWTPATPPLNPQLGCLPDSITSNPGVQPGEDDEVLQSDDETSRGENEDLSSMLSATPSTVQDSSEQEDEEDEDDVDVDEDDVKEEEVERNNEDGNVK
jgi:hypothetical protein